MKKIILTITLFLSLVQADVQLSKTTYENLVKIQELNEKKKYKEALILIEKRLSNDLKKTDKAYYLQSKGFILSSQNNYKDAIKAFEQMNALEVMDEITHLQTLYNLAQLAISINKYPKSIKFLKEYIEKNKKQNPDAYILLGQNYLFLEKITEAIPYIKEAIKIKKEQKQTVAISWYELLFSSYYNIKDYQNSIKYLNIMVRLQPLKKEYWEYLYQLYTLKKEYKKGLNTFEQAYNLEILNGIDIYKFVQFLGSNQLYFKSAKLLEKHINKKDIKANKKNLKLLYKLYYSAKEYQLSIKALDRLILVSKKSKHYLEKARIHNMIHQYHEAIQTYKIVLKDKNIKNYPKVVMELAYLYYELDNHKHCKECLHIAKNYKQTKKRALTFLKHL